MNMQLITNTGLISRLQKLVQTERKITHLVLECINEIELRRIHLESGYSSMFDFLTQKMGYTPASAQRRLESARLIRQMPPDIKHEINQKIENGSLQLSHLSMLQKLSREKLKQSGAKVSIQQKQEILAELPGKSILQSEVIIAKALDLAAPNFTSLKMATKEQHHQNESVTLTITFSKEEMELIQKVRHLKSHAVGSLEIKDVIVHLAKAEINKKMNSNAKFTIHNLGSAAGSRSFAEGQSIVGNKSIAGSQSFGGRQSFAGSQLDSVQTRQPCCEFQDPLTKKICGSKIFLTIDHIQPRWAGGGDEPQNLRVLCKNHNMYRYQRQAGIKKVRESLPLP